MKKITLVILLILSLFEFKAQEVCLLEQNPVEDLVQDYANILSATEIETLRSKLNVFNDTTSNQVLVVIVTNLCGYDKATFAYTLGQKWGVGHDKEDNGVVILVKPKTNNEKGAVFIAPGYGLEGVLSDAIVKRIIENQVIPSFKKDDYYQGISNAVNKVMEISSGEFSNNNEDDESSMFWWIVLFVIVGGFLLLMIIGIVVDKNEVKAIAKSEGLSISEAKKKWKKEKDKKVLAAKNKLRAEQRVRNKRNRRSVYINSSSDYSSYDSGSSFSDFDGGDFGGGGAGGEW